MSEEKGDALMAEAEKKLAKFSLFASNEEKADKARERFLQAATHFKACNNWLKAAQAYERAADMSTKNKSELEMAEDYQNAAMAYNKANNPRGQELLGQVVDMYDKNGKYTQAAKFCVVCAELGGPESLKWYERAVKYYKNDGARATAQELVGKTAELYVKAGQYEEGRKVYEQMAKDMLDDRLGRGGARKIFFMSLLCHLASITPTNLSEGVAVLSEKFNEFTELDTQFNEFTREHILIRELIAAIEEQSIDKYSEAVDEYDQICPLDDTKTKMLLRGKQLLRNADIR